MKKQLWTGLAAFIGCVIFLLDSSAVIEGARLGVELCVKTVIPSIFPFLFLSMLLTGNWMGVALPGLDWFGKLFHMPKGMESLLVCAFLGGYPVGAQSIAHSWKRKEIPKHSAERMLAYCNNAGPAFLFGMAGPMFSQGWTVWVLWGIHILSAWMVSRLIHETVSRTTVSQPAAPALPEILAQALHCMAMICGWVIIFRCVIAFLDRWLLWLLPAPWRILAVGVLELSNGCCALYGQNQEEVRFLLASVMLAFGGICVTMQTMSATKGLSLRYYFMGKGLQTIFSFLLSCGFILRQWYLLLFVPVFFLMVQEKEEKKCSNPRKAVV